MRADCKVEELTAVRQGNDRIGTERAAAEAAAAAADIAASSDGSANKLVMAVHMFQQQSWRVMFATLVQQAVVYCSCYLVGADELRELVLQATVNAPQPLAVVCSVGCVKQASATGISSLQANATVQLSSIFHMLSSSMWCE